MITYLQGDATHPVGDGPKIIMHVCNDRGGWGSGFVLALSKRWPEPEAKYRNWHQASVSGNISPFVSKMELGTVQIVTVGEWTRVANMIAQTGYGSSSGRIPLRYVALVDCLRHVAGYAKTVRASVHAPRIGCGLAGGTWDKVEPLIEEIFSDTPVFIYDLPGMET